MRMISKLLVTAACFAAVPASAQVIVLTSNLDLSLGAYSFGRTPTDIFTLSYDANNGNDPVFVQTSGNAAVPLIFGQPAVTFTDEGRTATFGPGYFPGFGSVPTATAAPFSITSSDLGLRYSIGGDDYYGYARFAGPDLMTVAFETTPNTPIMGGALPQAAVPEPASWAMMIGGFGLLGAAMRRRRPAYRIARVIA